MKTTREPQGNDPTEFSGLVRRVFLRVPSADVAEAHLSEMRLAAGKSVRPVSPLFRHRRRIAVLAAAATFMLAGSGVAVAADTAVPGDSLYGVDRAIERLQLAMARSPESEVNTHLAQAAERLGEIDVLRARGRQDRIGRATSDLARSEDRALASAQKAIGKDFEALHAHVLEMIGKHVTRLGEVRARLEASGHASPNALQALERAMENGAKAAGKVHQGRSGDASGAPGNSGEHRRDDNPGTEMRRGPVAPAGSPRTARGRIRSS
ncbi:MAG: DUF5667 domain-containing protein [Actinomycetota bacterium]